MKIYNINTYCSFFFTNNFELISVNVDVNVFSVVVELFYLWSFRVLVQSKFTIMWM